MSSLTWIGTDGDWNDPSNWSTGVVPIPDDDVTFSAVSPATVEGAAFVGPIFLSNGDLTISGDLATNGQSAASIFDELGSEGTLTIDPWGNGTFDTLTLTSSSLTDLGSLLTTDASIASGVIDGSAAQWIGENTTVTDHLTLQNGGSFFGNISLDKNATLSVDSISSFSSGTITANGNAMIDFLSPSVGGSYTQEVPDSLFVSAGSTLTLNSANGGTIYLEGSQVGPGYISIANASLTFLDNANTISSANDISASSSQKTSSYLLTGSELDFRNQTASEDLEDIVQTKGTMDTVLGGRLSLWVTADVSSLVDVVLGSGQSTVFGSSGVLSVTGGSGDLVVYDVNSADSLVGGSANNTLIGGAGSIIYASGSGTNVLGTSSSSAYLNGSATTGDTTLFAGVGTGIATLIGGSGSDVFIGEGAAIKVLCGAGNDSVWASTASVATIVGGSGNDIIQASASAFITVSGAGSDVIVTGEGTAQIDSSGQIGHLTTFSDNSSACNLIAGAGVIVAVVGSTNFHLSDASSGSEVWCLDKANVSLTGLSSATLVVAGSGDTINASSSMGTNVIFVATSSNSLLQLTGGANKVICGASDTTIQFDSGTDTVFAGSGHMMLDFGDPGQFTVSAIVLGFNPASDTLNFNSSPTIEKNTSSGIEVDYGRSAVLLWDYSGPLSTSS